MNMRKRIRSLLITFMLGLSLLLPPAGAAAQTFTDIEGHWAKQEIIKLSDGGYIKGYGNNTFLPDRTITRAEFLAVLMKLKGIQTTGSGSNAFTDISGHWARDLINESVKQGIVVKNEYTGIFKPNQALKRSEATAMMVRALGQAPDNSPITFKDKTQVEKSIYRGFIKKAYDLGLISCFPDGQFKPFDLVTRAQACTMLNRFAEKNGVTVPAGGSTNPVDTGNLSKIMLAGKTLDFRTTPVYIKVGMNEIRVVSLSTSSGSLFINNTYNYSLNPGTNWPDVITSNSRYKVGGLSLSGSTLVVVPTSMRLNRLALGNLRYDPEYVRLYVNRTNGDYYLHDMEIIDQYTVKVAQQQIDLRSGSIAIAAGSQFYVVKRVILNAGDTSLELTETTPVVLNRLTLADIENIYTGSTRYDLSRLSRLDFIIDGSSYTLSELTVDSSGSISVDGKTYQPGSVIMILQGDFYTLKEIRNYEGKLTLYCNYVDNTMARVDGKYVDASRVQILRDQTPYPLSSVVVVSRNLLRIGGKQYTLDSTFDCRFDGKLYDIKEIDYDSTFNLVTLKLTESSASSSQPARFLFYRDNSLLQSTTAGVTVYVNRTWRSFDDIIITDPLNYTYGGTSYSLLGAWIKIAGQEYEVTDTIWQGSTQRFKLYLEEI